VQRNYTLLHVWGIPIRVNVSLLVFLPVLVWLVGSGEQIEVYASLIEMLTTAAVDPSALGGQNARLLVGVGAALGLLTSVTLHELGHSWVAMRYDIGVESITLWILGGLADLAEMSKEPDCEFWIAVAGPVTSVAIGVLAIVALGAVPASATAVVFVLGFVAVTNLVLAVFNMIPAFPMDGGRVLRALLARSRPYAEATQTAASVGKAMAVLMAVLAALAFAPLMLLVAMFVYVAAGAESRATVLRGLLRGMTARDLMSSDVRTVTPGTSVAEFLDRVVTEKTTAYPVMDKGTVTGLVTLDAVQRVPADDRASTPVTDVMGGAPPSVDPDADAFEVLETLSGSGGDRVLVVEREATASDGRFLGQVTTADLVTAIEVLQGLGTRRDRDLEMPDGYA